MFITNTILNNQIIERAFFWTLTQAREHAIQQAKEKVWHISPTTVYFGDVEIRVYDSNDYDNEHFLSFIDTN
jgi:gamma-glutamyl:cysteine ligase YbdK (ATP-grasp superfamily)